MAKRRTISSLNRTTKGNVKVSFKEEKHNDIHISYEEAERYEVGDLYNPKAKAKTSKSSPEDIYQREVDLKKAEKSLENREKAVEAREKDVEVREKALPPKKEK